VRRRGSSRDLAQRRSGRKRNTGTGKGKKRKLFSRRDGNDVIIPHFKKSISFRQREGEREKGENGDPHDRGEEFAKQGS